MPSDPEPAETSDAPRLALLIDAENANAATVGAVIAELGRFGRVIVRRAYGDWGMQNLKPWQDVLVAHGLAAVQQPRLVKGKSLSDVALLIDAMDLLHAREVDAFCLMSSDSDFAPLALRIRAAGRMVIGVGGAHAKDALRAACDGFVLVDDLQPPPVPALPVAAPPVAQPTARRGFANAVAAAIQGCRGADGWALLSEVGNRLDPSLRAGGKLSKRVAALPMIELRLDRGPDGAPTLALVRLLPAPAGEAGYPSNLPITRAV